MAHLIDRKSFYYCSSCCYAEDIWENAGEVLRWKETKVVEKAYEPTQKKLPHWDIRLQHSSPTLADKNDLTPRR